MKSDTTRPTALVTGASSGIGLAFTKQLLKSHRVIAVSRCYGELEGITSPHLEHFPCDLTLNRERQNLIDKLNSGYKKIDVLINNAATQTDRPNQNFTWAECEQELRLNLFAPIHLTLELGHLLSKAFDPLVINMGSMLGFTHRKASPLYSISKAGIHQLSKILNADEQRFRSIEFIPPMIATQMTLARGRKGLLSADEFVSLALKNRHRRGTVYIGKAKWARLLMFLCPQLLAYLMNREAT